MADEVTGVSRSGRVRKKSSKLLDFESPEDIMKRQRNLFRPEADPEFPENRLLEGDYSGSDSEEFEHPESNGNSSDDSSSSDSDTERPHTPARSLYMMEKSNKKKMIVRDGKVVGRAKAQRKDKGKTRITAYMMWAKEARNELLKYNPQLDFSTISKRLGEMWSNVNYNERYLWKRRAKRLSLQREKSAATIGNKRIISNAARRKSVNRPKAPPKSSPGTSPQGPAPTFRVTGCGALEVAAHLRLLGDSLAIIGARLKEHEGQIAVSGSVSVLLDSWLCSVASLMCLFRAVPGLEPPVELLQETLHNIAYIMPGL